EAFYEGRRQCCEEREADEVSARKQRHHEAPAEEPQVLPPDDPTVEPNLLRLPQPFIDLRQRAEKNQEHRQREADDCETKGGEESPEAHRDRYIEHRTSNIEHPTFPAALRLAFETVRCSMFIPFIAP